MTLIDLQYSVEVEKPTRSDRLGVRRCLASQHEFIHNMDDQELENCWSIFQLGCKKNRHGRCLGRRTRNAEGELGDYEWLTYQDVEDKAIYFGSALLDLNIVKQVNALSEPYPPACGMKFLPICSANCIEWFICEQAAYAYGLTLLPLYDTFGVEALQYIVEQAEITFACSSLKCISTLFQIVEKCKSLTSIIVFEKIPSNILETAHSLGVTLYCFEELVSQKKRKEISPGKKDDITTLCYTSGSTEMPKGALLTQGNFIACVCSILRGHLNTSFNIHVSTSDVHLSYLPLAHVFERSICNIIFAVGASIGVYSADVTKLLDDIQKLRPTIFISVPRLFSRIDSQIMSTLQSKSSFVQQLFGIALNSKLARLHATANSRHLLWDALMFRKTRQLLGGNIRIMLVGGAPIDSTIQDRAKIFFGAPLMEGYGLTETFGTSFVASPDDPVSGHVGGPIAGIEFSLCDVEEMKYRVTDFPPAGEILLRGPVVFKGYFKNDTETQAVFDQDGWFHTGDIGVLLPNGALKIIDRRKNIFKLSQGEYVVPEKIEAVYSQASLIFQVFVFGSTKKSYIIAIIVPNSEAATRWQEKRKAPPLSLEDLCALDEFKAAVAHDLEVAATARGLKGYEKIRFFHLHPVPFSVENGMLTPTFKYKRSVIRESFSSILEKLYEKEL